MSVDPKWLEILKASGWHTTALTAASGVILYLGTKKRLPVAPDSRVVETAEILFVVFGFLSLANIASHFAKPLGNSTRRWWAVRQAKRQVEKSIPSMSSKEREIIGYLLANNQKMFTYTIDGGYASTLISKRIVVCALLPGQRYTSWEVPFEIPDHVWDVLVKHKGNFSNTWKDGEPYPYAIHWMSR